MDRQNMHLVWGDSPSGFHGVRYGRVRLAGFDVTPPERAPAAEAAASHLRR